MLLLVSRAAAATLVEGRNDVGKYWSLCTFEVTHYDVKSLFVEVV
jgi:hypothetical protein